MHPPIPNPNGFFDIFIPPADELAEALPTAETEGQDRGLLKWRAFRRVVHIAQLIITSFVERGRCAARMRAFFFSRFALVDQIISQSRGSTIGICKIPFAKTVLGTSINEAVVMTSFRHFPRVVHLGLWDSADPNHAGR